MLKKVTKGVKKAAKATYNFAVGDDIKTLQSKNTKWYQKAGAAVSIASNFIPGGGVASKVAKAAIKGTAKAATAVKASKAIVKSSKVVKSTAKKAASTINKKPKVVPAPSIKSAPKTQSVAPVKVSNTTPAAKPKVASAPQPKRGLVATRSETNANVAPPAGKGCNCFTAGTKVVTKDGEKNIEDIEVGDKVLAKDEKNADGELAYKEVEALYRNQRDDIIKLHVGDQIIETTDNHPFWVEGKGWVFADDLQAGDQLQKADGTNLTIEKVESIKLDEPVTVYNFTVEDYHTYYVTDIGIWVHNTQCSIGSTKGTGNVVKQNDVVPYRPSSSPLENHHGVLDVWAKHNIPNYQSRGANTPTIALTKEQHGATKEVYRNWLYEKTGKKVGGQINWTNIFPKEMQSLSERMFDAANVPQSARQDYYRAFNQYNYRE